MPSEARRSKLGVRPAMIPRWYAPTLNQPMSSAMMTMMFGFLPLGSVGAVLEDVEFADVDRGVACARRSSAGGDFSLAFDSVAATEVVSVEAASAIAKTAPRPDSSKHGQKS